MSRVHTHSLTLASHPVARPTIATDRLIIRPFVLSDAPAVTRLAGEWEIADTTLSIPHPYELSMAEAWIAGHEAMFVAGTNIILAITRLDDGALVGAIGLHHIVLDHQAEMGYWVGVPFWGMGYCTEAAAAVIDWAFRETSLVRIHANHLTRNPASGRVMEKIGMHPEGVRRRHVYKWGTHEDIANYGVLKEEWKQ